MNDTVNLENLNDVQKVWLCDLSFVDITEKGYEKISQECLTISELKNYIKDPNLPFCGNLSLESRKFNNLAEFVLGNDKFPSNLDVVNSLIENGLGSLKIKHVSECPNEFSSGFQALTFEDSYGNIGISFRGSDLYISRIALKEWLESNFFEYFSNTSEQAADALEYFQKHKSSNGKNYIYGHSLGGNLVSHVYLDCHDEIKQAFIINGTPINQKLIDTEDKIKAFNNKTKFSFNVVCGDIIGQLKSCGIYKNNVNYIKNNDTMKPSFISAHMIQSSTFDENGNFVKITESEMKKHISCITLTFINLSKFTREQINKIHFSLKRENSYDLNDNKVKKNIR